MPRMMKLVSQVELSSVSHPVKFDKHSLKSPQNANTSVLPLPYTQNMKDPPTPTKASRVTSPANIWLIFKACTDTFLHDLTGL